MADNKFLDKQGLVQLWSKIETIFPRIRQETDSEYASKSNSFIPVNNELCIVNNSDGTVRMKVGNGSTIWAELPYLDENVIKLYSSLGDNTDGTINQKVLTQILNSKVGTVLNASQETLNFVI